MVFDKFEWFLLSLLLLTNPAHTEQHNSGELIYRNGFELNHGISGWTGVTEPLEATGSGSRIDVGGGNMDHVDLSTLDPGLLQPGDVVNLFHRSTPYNSRLAFTEDGNQQNPIIINGVTDGVGNRPQINCAMQQPFKHKTGQLLLVVPMATWLAGYSPTVVTVAHLPTQFNG